MNEPASYPMRARSAPYPTPQVSNAREGSGPPRSLSDGHQPISELFRPESGGIPLRRCSITFNEMTALLLPDWQGVAMTSTNAQRRRWVANALARAAELPDCADRDVLLQIARDHLLAIAQEGCPTPVSERLTVSPSGIW